MTISEWRRGAGRTDPAVRKSEWRVDAERTHAALVDELHRSGAYHTPLFRKLARCGQATQWQSKAFCRSSACPICRGRYIGKMRREAEQQFGGQENHQLGLLTLVLEATSDTCELERAIKKARTDLRNFVDARRRQEPGLWRGFKLLGWLQVDAVDPEQEHRLGPNRRELLAQFPHRRPVFLGASSPPTWVLHLHAVVTLADIGPGLLASAFAERWSAPGQVDVRRFYRNRSKRVNISGVVNYMLRMDCKTDLNGEEEPWKPHWVAQHFHWLEGYSRGFQSLKVRVGLNGTGARGGAPDPSVEPADDELEDDADGFLEDRVIEPMPMAFARTSLVELDTTLTVQGAAPAASGRRGQGAIHRRPADPDPARDLHRPDAFAVEPQHVPGLRPRRRRPAAVSALDLRPGDPLLLPLQHEPPLEVSDRAEQDQHKAAGGRGGVQLGAAHGQDAQADALRFQAADDGQEVGDRPREAAGLGHRHGIAVADELQQGLKLLPPGRHGRHLFGEHLLAADGLEVPDLGVEPGLLPFGRRDPGVSDQHLPTASQ